MWVLDDAQDVVYDDSPTRHLLRRLHANVPRDLVEVDACDVRHSLPRGEHQQKKHVLFLLSYSYILQK